MSNSNFWKKAKFKTAFTSPRSIQKSQKAHIAVIKSQRPSAGFNQNRQDQVPLAFKPNGIYIGKLTQSSEDRFDT
jgi:hypothetical protein